jgi:hypothetical protein
MIQNKFSFVMPMIVNHRTAEDNDLERILKIQLPTFRKFLKLEDLHKFYIVTRKSDISIIREALEKEYSDFPFEYVDELELIPQLKTFPLHQVTVHPGWMIQQMAKLELAKQIETEYYFSFETDLFLTRSFSYDNMFNNGKLICSYFTQFEGSSTKESWHMYSTALVLPGVTDFILDSNAENDISGEQLTINKVMGVSPQILITKEVIALIEYLERIHNMNYLDLLLRTTSGHPNTWTEYTLYWMWLFKNKTFDTYYSFESPYISGNELWTSNYKKGYHKQYFEEFDTLIMNNPNHYFNVIQSNILDIKLDYIQNKLNKHLDN